MRFEQLKEFIEDCTLNSDNISIIVNMFEIMEDNDKLSILSFLVQKYLNSQPIFSPLAYFQRVYLAEKYGYLYFKLLLILFPDAYFSVHITSSYSCNIYKLDEKNVNLIDWDHNLVTSYPLSSTRIYDNKRHLFINDYHD